MSKIKNFWKGLSRGWRWAIIIFAIVIILFFVFRLIGGGNESGQTVTVTRKNIVQKVSVSGKVESAQKVELAFEVGGVVRQIARQEGDKVKAGDLIASLNTAELSVRLARQWAALEKARLALATLVEPPKAVDRLATENELAQDHEALAQAQDDSAQAVTETLVDLPTILNKLDDIVRSGSGYLSSNEIRFVGGRAEDYKKTAEASYWSAEKSYDQVKKNPDLKSIYQTTKLTATAINDLYALITYMEDQSDNAADSSDLVDDKATLDTYTDEINDHLAALLTASNDLEKTERDVIEAEEKLRDLLDGADTKDISTKQLDVRQAELDVQETQVQIAKQQIRAPFDGVVARNDLELGETVSAGSAMISMISENAYEVISRVPEAEISKIKVGDPARITFDAYPPEELQLAARVSAVNLAEVVVDGVATYKVTLQFATSSDSQSGTGKIKSGMTVNVEITGASKADVLVIPERALSFKDGSYVVRVVQDKTIAERSVIIGLRGSDGQAEIISGLAEGDSIVVGMLQ
jgi:HlyD family secretion protein